MIEILEEPEVRHEVQPISLSMYHTLRDAGLLDTKVELIEGTLIKKMSKSPLHSLVCQRLVEWLRGSLAERSLFVRQEQPLTLENSEPEPDVSVVEGVAEDYAASHPATALFVAEIAIASRRLDEEKANIYAAAGIAEYWLILPDDKTIVVHRRVSENGYLETQRVQTGESVVCEVLDVRVDVSSLLG